MKNLDKPKTFLANEITLREVESATLKQTTMIERSLQIRGMSKLKSNESSVDTSI